MEFIKFASAYLARIPRTLLACIKIEATDGKIVSSTDIGSCSNTSPWRKGMIDIDAELNFAGEFWDSPDGENPCEEPPITLRELA